jgi:probable phosphoglycerate mutase
MKIYITRHGETMRNAEQRILGRTDDPLSVKGRVQAAELAEKMKDVEIDLIFSSPLSRAKETADTIAAIKNMSVIVDDRLIETDFGDFEGRPRNLEEYQAAKRDHFKRYPGGESYFDIAYRVYDFLFMLKREYADKKVLVVAHGGICRIICNYFYDMENEEFVRHAFPNCGLEDFEL